MRVDRRFRLSPLATVCQHLPWFLDEERKRS